MRLAVPLVVTLVLAGGVLIPERTRADDKRSRQSVSERRTWRHPQRAPTRERYKQIQRALKARGYNPGPIDGRWGSRSAAALKRFERDHDLPADGRLDALVLIMLGLGPKRSARTLDYEPPSPKKEAQP